MSQQVIARSGTASLAMRGHMSFSATESSSSGLLPAEAERIDRPPASGNSQGMPSDVLDKLLVIYFTHVHVSVLDHLTSTADYIESLANNLQASFHSRNYINTAAQCNALRRGLRRADIRARPLR